MIKTRLYLYDSTQPNYKGTDYSNYVLQGNSYKEDLSQELDTATITLQGISRSKEFEPETKFILEQHKLLKRDGQEVEELVYTYDIVVEQDTVTQPILSDNTYFVHTISFIEASVIAQKRLVDNISATYKLKYVSLENLPTFDIDENSPYKHDSSAFSVEENFLYTSESNFWYYEIETRHIGKYFVFEGDIAMYNITSPSTSSTKLYRNIADYEVGSGTGVYSAKFSLPKIAIYFGDRNAKTFTKIGYASIDWVVQEFSLYDSTTPTKTWSGIVESDSSFQNTAWSWHINDYGLSDRYLVEKYAKPSDTSLSFYNYIRQYSNPDSSIIPNYFTNNIQIQSDKRYVVTINLHRYPYNLNYDYAKNNDGGVVRESKVVSKKSRFSTAFYSIDDVSNEFSDLHTSAIATYQTYDVDSLPTLLTSANPYSALSLIQKAIINTNVYNKVANVYIGDTNARNNNGVLISPYPFYIDDKYVSELGATQINENFYNQKNLWEILLEVGNYIHAIPEIKFGENDKFMITFNKLGSTNECFNNCTKTSITNFKNIDDYISSCSSYISNMVQLGGKIEEYASIKTSNEYYLIFNDTAQIILSKPIIELLEIKIKCNSGNYSGIGIAEGEEADFTNFVFERNVYDILPIRYDLFPNRGVSLFYSLGDNKIQGGDYRTPTSNSGEKQNDYAFKKAIYSAYNGYNSALNPSGEVWTKIYVSDFTFKVTYRTKASVRQNQSRPDLRKYLLNSKFDEVPQHNQFNNQTDILVDSEKFGNMVYGKLIRTGNTTYAISEYTDNLNYLKHKGELYRISEDDNNIYFVSKVTHTFFADHIASDVEYSKDYNQLSQVVGIPSEPRFYEISEQSSIDRQVAINDYLLLSIGEKSGSGNHSYIKDISHLSKVMFGSNDDNENKEFAKYVSTVFKGDKDIVNEGDNTLGIPNAYTELISPTNAYSSQNTLTYTWQMRDNYGAGDRVIPNDEVDGAIEPLFLDGKDNVYRSLENVKYCDTYGKSSLFDFALIEDLPEGSPDYIAVRNMPINSMFSIRYLSLTMGGLYQVGGETIGRFVTINNKENELFNINNTSVTYNGTIETTIHRTIIGLEEKWYVEIVNNLPTSGTHWFNWAYSLSASMVQGDISVLASNISDFTNTDYNGRGLSLLKDNREVIGFNYNIQLLTDSDQFILSPYLFEDNKSNVKLVLLNKEVNKLNYGFIDNADIIVSKNGQDVALNKFFDIELGYESGLHPTHFNVAISDILEDVNQYHFYDEFGGGYQLVKSIAIIYNVQEASDTSVYVPNKYKLIMARNIPENTTSQAKTIATQDWYIDGLKDNYFTNKQ